MSLILAMSARFALGSGPGLPNPPLQKTKGQCNDQQVFMDPNLLSVVALSATSE